MENNEKMLQKEILQVGADLEQRCDPISMGDISRKVRRILQEATEGNKTIEQLQALRVQIGEIGTSITKKEQGRRIKRAQRNNESLRLATEFREGEIVWKDGEPYTVLSITTEKEGRLHLQRYDGYTASFKTFDITKHDRGDETMMSEWNRITRIRSTIGDSVNASFANDEAIRQTIEKMIEPRGPLGKKFAEQIKFLQEIGGDPAKTREAILEKSASVIRSEPKVRQLKQRIFSQMGSSFLKKLTMEEEFVDELARCTGTALWNEILDKVVNIVFTEVKEGQYRA